MKYQRKPTTIEADQLILDTPHPLLGSPTEIHVPEHVKKHKDCGYRMCDLCGGATGGYTYYVNTVSGIRTIYNGDYVTVDKYGQIDVVRKNTFEEQYEKVQ